jgi:hypothetical protein
MPIEDPQRIWAEYYQRKKAERIGEAKQMAEMMRLAGVSDETILAVDFVHFGTSQSNIEELSKQLAENYQLQVVQSEDQGHWLAKGTTRPYGITLSAEQHIGWVGFMADVAQSYSCVFSTWTIEAPSLHALFESEQIESDSCALHRSARKRASGELGRSAPSRE